MDLETRLTGNVAEKVLKCSKSDFRKGICRCYKEAKVSTSGLPSIEWKCSKIIKVNR